MNEVEEKVIFHFLGERETNNIYNPNWMLEFLLDFIKFNFQVFKLFFEKEIKEK